MADKEVLINSIVLVHGQGVKESFDKTGADSIVCFDEAITHGSGTITYKLTIDRVVFENREDYEKLSKELKKMLNTPGDVTTREIIRYKADEPFTIVKNYHGCILDGKDYEMKPEEMSAESISFICSSVDEYTEDA